jgi:hypothetical protein
MRTVVLAHWNEDRQYLVCIYDDGHVTVAERDRPYDVWGPPSSAVVTDDAITGRVP